MPIINMSSVLTALVQSIDNKNVMWLTTVEFTLESVYVVDLVTRFVTCVHHKLFFFDPYNVIDLVAVTTLCVRVAYLSSDPEGGGPVIQAMQYMLFCVAPILRMLKTLRHFDMMHLLIGAFQEAIQAVPVLMFVWFLMALCFATLIFIVEDRDLIPNFPHAMWFVIVTISTVGYGDTVPESSFGRIISVITMMSGVLYTAIPLGLISYVFANCWQSRHRILFIKRLKNSFVLQGVRPRDLIKVFEEFDDDGSGEIDAFEWAAMMQTLQVDVSDAGKQRGFQHFVEDEDADGVTLHRLVFLLWPEQYHDVFKIQKSRTGQLQDSDGGLPEVPDDH